MGLKGLKTAIKKLTGFDEAKLGSYLEQFTAAANKAAGGKLDLDAAVKMVAGNKYNSRPQGLDSMWVWTMHQRSRLWRVMTMVMRTQVTLTRMTLSWWLNKQA